MSHVALKIVGAQGQGLNSIGEIVAKGLKRAGYCVFGYKEYMSVIKGGHSSYQLDVDTKPVFSSDSKVDILITMNHHGFEHNLHDVKDGGVIVHDVADWNWNDEDTAYINKHAIRIVYIPLDEILQRLKAKSILSNVILTAFVWSALGRKEENLKNLVGEKFAKKKDLLELNMKCVEEGFRFDDSSVGTVTFSLPDPDPQYCDHLLVTGSQAMGMGVVHAGVRLFAGYPMTPSSPLLGYISSVQDETGMVIKQAEDEITAAQMVSGAMHMGTRALTATSGGGFDLMSETLSLNGIIENPTVFILAQRPGPATGLPTWTAQGDLLMATYTSHGEFPRCILAVSDAQDSFDLLPVAFNIAEEYQISVIVLTDKHVAEALYTQKPYDQEKASISRGKLVTDPQQLAKLKSEDRYDTSSEDGISKRWLPGSHAATYCAQGDEHTENGTVDESADNAIRQMEKRMRKGDALKKALPEPELYVAENGEIKIKNEELKMKNDGCELDVLLVGWGSTKGAALDAMQEVHRANKALRIGYLHYTYVWPLKTERFERLVAKAEKVILIEGNYQGQLGLLLRQQCGYEITDKILRYDGRPFFTDQLRDAIAALL